MKRFLLTALSPGKTETVSVMRRTEDQETPNNDFWYAARNQLINSECLALCVTEFNFMNGAGFGS
jgi:hypothetical protein